MIRERVPRLLALALAATALLGCGGDGGGEALGGPGETVEVLAVDNSFRPEPLTVLAGTTVEWTNKGRNAHDIVPVDGSTSWGIALDDFGPAATYSHVFSEPGEYAYYCSVHGTKTAGMVGVVSVK